jgi:hypothetical protein
VAPVFCSVRASFLVFILAVTFFHALVVTSKISGLSLSPSVLPPLHNLPGLLGLLVSLKSGLWKTTYLLRLSSLLTVIRYTVRQLLHLVRR